ncbi:MMPL family transporter [Saccharopolyspora rhizosphaerae]|uniref:MMPL family transporter n=1 Tax=Saccharopolyspora rhizosphaerae TaxID=2492662 RepID=A0A426JQL3_9PSEU|nr:MMPL family transporter [Saccharopolyspora rhizosphaerae]RRO15421.1 MMPL family transporter [Saccharopolyspora rhizosphaerae]
MSSLLHRLGRAVVRGRAWVLVAWLALLAVLGTGAALFQQGMETELAIPGSESQDTLDHLNNVFPQMSGSSAQLVATTPPGERIDSPEGREAIESLIHRVEGQEGVTAVMNPLSDMVDNQVSADGDTALITVQLSYSPTAVPENVKTGLLAEAENLERQLGPGSDVHAGGPIFAVNMPAVGATEAVGVVVALLVLMLMLRSLVGAVMPLITALIGVGVSMTVVLLSTAFVTVSSAAPMLGLMLGLAVGIDYSLFIVSRHREQLGEGLDVAESIARSVATAGSAVIFAGVTVIIALLALAVPGIPFLTVMGILAGVSIAVGVAASLTVIPALLSFAGERLRPKATRNKRTTRPRTKFSLRWVRAVTKAPLLTIVVVIAGLGLCTLPAADLRLSVPDAGAQAVGTPARDTYDAVAEQFGPGYNAPLIVTTDVIGTKDPLGQVNGMADEIRALPGVAAVPLATPNETIDTGIIQVIPTAGGESQTTEDLVHELRDLSPHFEQEYGAGIAVTGMTAIGIDLSEKLSDALLPFGVIVVGLTLVLLAMVFRSVWVPVKAALGYLLSVGATFGATAFVFNQGHLAEQLNITHVGGVISFLPLLLMAILFGLAMDYEVFLVSRMREEYAHHRDAGRAIEAGFSNVSPVVVAAAVIMISVFAAFVPHGDSNIKPIAFGLAVGVFVDAFLVRMTLVPAVMALLGDRAWWLPKWLARKLPALDVEGEALEHELRLANWPGNDEVVSARDFSVRDDRAEPIFEGVRIALRPGGVLAVQGDDDDLSSAMLHALGGRLSGVQGDVRVLGLLLPQRARAVRSRTALVRCRESEAPAAEIAAAMSEGVRLVLVDELDAVADTEQRREISRLLTEASTPDGEPVTFVVTHQNPSLVSGLLPEHRLSTMRLSARPTAPTFAGRLLEV